jgi:transposase-like protein
MKERQMNGVKQRRQFDETSKRHAVELSLRGERIVKAVAEELGISPDRLYLWRGLYAPKPSGIAQAKPDRTIEQVEEDNRQLRAEVLRLREREIVLKKHWASSPKSPRAVCPGQGDEGRTPHWLAR